MKTKHAALTGTAILVAAASLVVLRPSVQSSGAVIPPSAQESAVTAIQQVDDAAREAARIEAERSRAAIPQLEAAREEARRLAEEQARQAAEAKARQEAAEAKAREEAAAAKAREAAAAQARREAARQPTANAAPAPRPTVDSGIAPSTYTGPMYNAAYEGTRTCIVRKESGGNYGIVSSNGAYHGAYQFSRSTADAVAARMGRGDLVGTPASRWSRAEQDMAFWTLWNNGAGRGNWPTARGC